MQQVQTTFPKGTVIQGHYCVESLLSKGPSGAIYLVRDQRVKEAQGHLFVLKQVIDLNQHERHHLIFEDVLLRQLPHPALPCIYHVFGDDRHGWVYILMEYIEGPNLDTLRQQQPGHRFSWPEALTIMAPILEAVHHLHRQQPPLIHGDIKPINIIVPKTATGAVLVDLGIRKAYPDATLAVGRAHSSSYQAPEQASGGSGKRTDIYGLGATFYTLLTGVVPPDALSRLTQLDNERIDPLKAVNEAVPTVPAYRARVIYQAMALYPYNRFSSVEQFCEALWSPVEYSSPPGSSRGSTPSFRPVVTKQVTRPATVSVPKPPLAPRSWKLSAFWPSTPRPTVARPATVSVPKQPRAPHSWKLSSLWPPALKQLLMPEGELVGVSEAVQMTPPSESLDKLVLERSEGSGPTGWRDKLVLKRSSRSPECRSRSPERSEGEGEGSAPLPRVASPSSIRIDDRFPTVEEFWQALNADPTWRQLPVPSVPATAPLSREPQPAPPLQGEASPLQERSGTSRSRKLGILIWALLALFAVLVVGASLWSSSASTLSGGEVSEINRGLQKAVIHHAATSTSQPAVTPTATPTSQPAVTPTAVPATPVPATPTLAASYQGTIRNTSIGVTSAMSLTNVKQYGENISGYFTLGPELLGSGPFTGTVDTAQDIQFAVPGVSGNGPLHFSGSVQPGGTLKGSYCSLDQTNRCNPGAGGSGAWSVKPV